MEKATCRRAPRLGGAGAIASRVTPVSGGHRASSRTAPGGESVGQPVPKQRERNRSDEQQHRPEYAKAS